MVDLKAQLWDHLRGSRSRLWATLDGLSDYDLRRPMTPTGTNLLGLVKHVAGEEYGYLGESFGRPPAEPPTWFRDDPYTEIDLWATPDESTAYIRGVYHRACDHADVTIGELDLDSPGQVAHWANHETTLSAMMILMAGETAQHAGHAEIVRELIDGHVESRAATDHDFWQRRRVEIQTAADAFR